MMVYIVNPLLKVIIDIGAAAAGSGFGAWVAFKAEAVRQARVERRRTLGRVFLIREDILKAKRFLTENLGQLERHPSFRVQLFAMPDTYTADLDYVALLHLLGKDGVDHIRNISQYVFPQWKMAVQHNEPVEMIAKRAKDTIECCDKVLSALEIAAPELHSGACF